MIIKISRFSLAPLTGTNRLHGERSQLCVDGQLTPTVVPGKVLLHQFHIPAGLLLATDYDCPHEETANFILLDETYKIVSQRSLGTPAFTFVPNCSYLLKDIEWLDDWHFLTIPYGDTGEKWHFTIRRRGIPFLYPQLTMSPVHE